MASATAWLIKRFSSFAWRFTFLFTSLLLILISTLLFVLYQLSVGEISRNQQHQLRMTVQQQSLLSRELAPDEFLRQLNVQTQQRANPILAYRSREASLGYLSNIPSHVTRCPQQSTFLVDGGDDDLRVFSGCVARVGQGVMLVAIDNGTLHFLQTRFMHASIVALLLTVFLGLFSGRYISRQLLTRIKGFNQVAGEVQNGDLGARMPMSKRDDEFDLLAQNINRMLNQVEHSFHAVSGVTDAIAHDLRTPLGRLRLMLESSLNAHAKAPVSEQTLQTMLEELDNILTTFSAMLELSRLEHKQANQALERLDMTAIADDVIELIQPLVQCEHQTLTFTNNSRPTSPIQGDKTLVFRAMFNCLENAVKYAGEGAKIELELTPTGFVVHDNGPGIPEAFHDKVFQRLYRMESSRTSAGYGLGLPLIQAIARFHGGQVTLSDNHPGLKVTVVLQDNVLDKK